MTAPLTAAQVADDLRLLSPSYTALEIAVTDSRDDSNDYPHNPHKTLPIEGRIAIMIAEGLQDLRSRVDAMIADAAPVEAIKLNAQAAADEALDGMTPEGRALFELGRHLSRNAVDASLATTDHRSRNGAMIGWYYLHENGALIYKPGANAAADIRDSDLARGMWPLDPEQRANAWNILVEAGAAGASPDRLAELAAKWHCDDRDAAHYAEHIGAKIFMDGNAWCATRADFENLQESPAGFGETAREALSELAKALEYRPSKMWGATFKDLLGAQANTLNVTVAAGEQEEAAQ